MKLRHRGSVVAVALQRATSPSSVPGRLSYRCTSLELFAGLESELLLQILCERRLAERGNGHRRVRVIAVRITRLYFL